ncbi:MAG: hypothetical protein KGD63_03960 [Candidatus Lokiarchaeota archaeon]|nr:hypothetical protein [Candidatus Lokiarchaeota archaeon]
MNDVKLDDEQIYITKEAFRNMITHVLRFGHDSLETNYEVIGFCLGRQDEDGKTQLINAIPVSHGKGIQISISQSYIDLIIKIEESYKEQDIKVIGWYISHPSNGVEWNEQDRKNHLSIQNNKKPKAFSIVFDHKLLKKENNFGFKIYRLLDYKKGDLNRFKLIDFKIEEPKTMDYFKWVKKFAEDFHKSNPILINEIREVSETIPNDLQEIPAPIEDFEEKESLPLERLKSSNTEFINKINTFIYGDIKNWMQNIDQITLDGSDKLLKLILEINGSISSGMNNLRNWSKQEIISLTDRVKETAKDLINKNIDDQKDFISQIKKKQEKLEEEAIRIINEQSKNNTEFIKAKIGSFHEKIDDLKTNQIKVKADINNIGARILKTKNKMDIITKTISNKLKEIIDNKRNENINKLNSMNTKINKFDKEVLEINEKVKDLENSISSSLKKI